MWCPVLRTAKCFAHALHNVNSEHWRTKRWFSCGLCHERPSNSHSETFSIHGYCFTVQVHFSTNKQTKKPINLAEDLTKFKVNGNYRMLTYDIKDLYVNIPTKEILRLTKSLLLKHNDARTTKQITLLDVILQQNYFSFKNHIPRPKTGISMGSPISSNIAEIFI